MVDYFIFVSIPVDAGLYSDRHIMVKGRGDLAKEIRELVEKLEEIGYDGGDLRIGIEFEHRWNANAEYAVSYNRGKTDMLTRIAALKVGE